MNLAGSFSKDLLGSKGKPNNKYFAKNAELIFLQSSFINICPVMKLFCFRRGKDTNTTICRLFAELMKTD